MDTDELEGSRLVVRQESHQDYEPRQSLGQGKTVLALIGYCDGPVVALGQPILNVRKIVGHGTSPVHPIRQR
jgi:hypothetical protein